MEITTKEWGDLQSTGLMFCQTLSQEVLKMEPSTDKIKEGLSYKERNANVICVGDTILAAAKETGID